MPEVVGDLAQGRELVEVIRHQPAHREPVQRSAAGEGDDQQHGEQERRHGVADDDGGAAPDVEAAAVAGRLADAQGNRHQVGDQRGPEPEGNGHRHFFQDQVGDLGATKEALAEIQAGVVLEHQPEALGGRFVEAVLALDIGDQLGVQAAAGP